MRFRQVYQRENPTNMRVIDRTSNWRKSVFEWLRELALNVRAVRNFKPDAVISSDHLMAVGACIYCRIKKIPFIYDVTDHWELVDPSLAGKLYQYLVKPLLARFSYAITSTSQRQYDYFHARRKANTYLIPNGINPRLLKALEKDKPMGSSGPMASPGSEVNFIGSLRDWYDYDLLFEVFREFPEISLHMYGQGPLYQELHEKSGDIPNIHVHGHIDPSRVAPLLSRSLFGILPLKLIELNRSTCPIKLFDYWAASKAVIATPVEEVMRLGGSSLLYASTHEDFVVRVGELIHDRGLARKLGEEGKKKVDRAHNFTKITDQFVQILNAGRF